MDSGGQAIGDYGDNIADVTRALVLAEKIRAGIETDQTIISAFTQYCTEMVEIYGGSAAIMEVLNFDLQGLQTYLAPYYPAKDETTAATTVSDAIKTVISTPVSPVQPIKII